MPCWPLLLTPASPNASGKSKSGRHCACPGHVHAFQRLTECRECHRAKCHDQRCDQGVFDGSHRVGVVPQARCPTDRGAVVGVMCQPAHDRTLGSRQGRVSRGSDRCIAVETSQPGGSFLPLRTKGSGTSACACACDAAGRRGRFYGRRKNVATRRWRHEANGEPVGLNRAGPRGAAGDPSRVRTGPAAGASARGAGRRGSPTYGPAPLPRARCAAPARHTARQTPPGCAATSSPAGSPRG